MAKQNNRKIAFYQYTKKWGLDKYKFMAAYDNNKVFVVSSIVDFLPEYNNHKIETLNSLMKRNKNTFIFRPNNNTSIEFDGLEELLEYLLIEKLAF